MGYWGFWEYAGHILPFFMVNWFYSCYSYFYSWLLLLLLLVFLDTLIALVAVYMLHTLVTVSGGIELCLLLCCTFV